MMRRQRLSAEAIRDSLLAVSGRLDTSMGGSLLPIANRAYVTSTANVNPAIYDTQRRSVYLPIVRSATYNVLQAFDFPDATVSSGKRDATVVASQALFMLNSELVTQTARTLATDLTAAAELGDGERLHVAFRRILGRSPTASETERGVAFVQQYQAAAVATEQPQLAVPDKAWEALCRTLLASNEFLYID
jgi:hypothetical protein